MALESATYIDDLNTSNPTGPDSQSQGDDHIRLIKSVLKNTFPNTTAAQTFGSLAAKSSGLVLKTSGDDQETTDDAKTIFYDCTSGALTFNLLAATTAGDGFTQTIIRDDTSNNLLTIDGAASETINGATTLVLGPGESVLLVCNGTLWKGFVSRVAMPGAIKMSAGLSSEIGWLACDGTAVSRTTYVRLYETITIRQTATTTSSSAIVSGFSSTSLMKSGMPVSGTGVPSNTTILSVDSSSQITLDKNATASGSVTIAVAPYGVGDGSTTFNVPDMRGRAPIGNGTGTGLTARVVGIGVGEEEHTLIEAELPVVTPTISSIGKKNTDYDKAGVGDGLNPNGTPDTVFECDPFGEGEAHNNMQPSLPVVFRIKV